MADKFEINGSWGTTPQTGSLLASGKASVLASIREVVTLALKEGPADYLLDADPAVPIDFGGVTNAHVVMIFSDQKIKVRYTSAEGSTQSLPGEVHMLISKTVPFTAIDIQRVVGQETRCSVFIGQKPT